MGVIKVNPTISMGDIATRLGFCSAVYLLTRHLAQLDLHRWSWVYHVLMAAPFGMALLLADYTTGGCEQGAAEHALLEALSSHRKGEEAIPQIQVAETFLKLQPNADLEELEQLLSLFESKGYLLRGVTNGGCLTISVPSIAAPSMSNDHLPRG